MKRIDIDTIDDLNPGEKFIAKWRYLQLGNFQRSLLELFEKADSDNLTKLKLAYPVEVIGYQNYCTNDGYWQKVEEKLQNNLKDMEESYWGYNKENNSLKE